MSRVTAKSEIDFLEIERLSDVSFPPGPERPSRLALKYAFDNGEVFVNDFVERYYRGFAIVTEVRGEPFIQTIAVDPKQRGLGIGTSLLAEIIRFYEMQHRSFIDLTVNVNNPAQKLYFDMGWRVVRVLQGHYGEDSGLKMRRTL